MRIKFTFLFILLGLFFVSKAQKNYCDGYIITLKNDTIRGKVKDNFPFRVTGLVKKISFIDSTGIEKDYLPKEIKGYSKEDIANYLSIEIGFSKDFAKVIIDGEVSLLSYKYSTTNSAFVPNGGGGGGSWTHTPSSSESFFLYKRNTGSLIEVTRLGFRDMLSTYFSDYKELKEMIERKELRYSDLEIIVGKYNKWKKKISSGL